MRHCPTVKQHYPTVTQDGGPRYWYRVLKNWSRYWYELLMWDTLIMPHNTALQLGDLGIDIKFWKLRSISCRYRVTQYSSADGGPWVKSAASSSWGRGSQLDGRLHTKVVIIIITISIKTTFWSSLPAVQCPFQHGYIPPASSLPRVAWGMRFNHGGGYQLGCFKKHKVSQIKFFFWYVLWL